MEEVEDLFEKGRREKGIPVAGVIVEPIQSEGGKREREERGREGGTAREREVSFDIKISNCR